MGLRAKGDAPGPALRPVVMRAGRAWRIAPSTDIASHKAGEEEGAAANGGYPHWHYFSALDQCRVTAAAFISED